jgi:hypothetical protein
MHEIEQRMRMHPVNISALVVLLSFVKKLTVKAAATINGDKRMRLINVAHQ